MRYPHIRRSSLRRVVADLLIVGGLGFLLYFPATWAYTWWEQRSLASALVEAHPGLTPERVYENLDELVDLHAERDAMRAEEEQARREQELQTFRQAAALYQATLASDGGGTPIGRILIPKIGVDVVMIEGTGKADLREGPGHWPETPLPGMGGNFVVSGHRTTYGAPFFKLDKLSAGDTIDLVLPYAVARYEVTESLIVGVYETEVVAQRDVEEVSLATCHPIYSDAQRLVVKAELVGFKVLDGASSAAGVSGAEG